VPDGCQKPGRRIANVNFPRLPKKDRPGDRRSQQLAKDGDLLRGRHSSRQSDYRNALIGRRRSCREKRLVVRALWTIIKKIKRFSNGRVFDICTSPETLLSGRASYERRRNCFGTRRLNSIYPFTRSTCATTPLNDRHERLTNTTTIRYVQHIRARLVYFDR